jgi:hypothetical protein
VESWFALLPAWKAAEQLRGKGHSLKAFRFQYKQKANPSLRHAACGFFSGKEIHFSLPDTLTDDNQKISFRLSF